MIVHMFIMKSLQYKEKFNYYWIWVTLDTVVTTVTDVSEQT